MYFSGRGVAGGWNQGTHGRGTLPLVQGVVPYYLKVVLKFLEDHQEKSLFLCYEDLVDPFQQEDMFHQVFEFMFPGRDTSRVEMPENMKASLIEQQKHHSVYSGGHSSNHDPELRARLRRLVKQYDGELFNNTVAKSNAIFGCGCKD